ncbi:MAG TPA: hypothetical protein VJT31_08405 [Rugosimonospora sp.]|nr:hypothetical protein [Rugosimonospora sp.]
MTDPAVPRDSGADTPSPRDERFDECFAIDRPWRPPGPVTRPEAPQREA